MAEYIEAETILEQRIVFQVALVGRPVVGQLLGAENEDCPIAQLVVFDDRQRRKRLAQANTVSEDAPVICLQLVDDAGGCVLLEVI